MTGTDLCVNKPHMSRSYLNHLVCMYVCCECVCVCVCVYVCIYIYMYMFIYAYMYVCIYIYIYIYMCVYVCIYYVFISSTKYQCSVTDGLSLFVAPLRSTVYPHALLLHDNLDF